VTGAAGTVARKGGGSLPEPSFRSVLLGGLPGFLREGFLPLAAFYVGLRLSGLTVGIAISLVVSGLVYAHERHIGREGLLVGLALVFVAVQALVGLLSDSATVYLAEPVLANAVWGVVFLSSAALQRPLAGLLACAWYPFPPEFRTTHQFKQVFGVESIVWGLYLLAYSALRLTVLLHSSVGSFVAVSFFTGTAATLLLVAWSIWYTIRRLSDDETATGSGAGKAPIWRRATSTSGPTRRSGCPA
jgi:intracellular septation protein A